MSQSVSVALLLLSVLASLLLTASAWDPRNKDLKRHEKRSWKPEVHENEVACGNVDKCPVPMCVDFVVMKTRCCPVCPDGE